MGGNPVQKPAVVGNHHSAAGKAFQGLLHGINNLVWLLAHYKVNPPARFLRPKRPIGMKRRGMEI